MADKCESFGLIVPEFTGDTRARLEQSLPFFGSARNPVDMTSAAGTDPSLYGKCLRAIVENENVDMVVTPGFFLSFLGAAIVEDVLDTYRSTDKPIVLSPIWSDDSPEAREMIKRVKQEGIPMIRECSDAARAMASLAWYQEKVTGGAAAGGDAEGTAYSREEVSALLRGSEVLTEYEGKQILAACGIPTTREGLAAAAEDAVTLARQIGYPVALKVQSPQILHKTEANGIRLGLKTDEEVLAAYDEILKSVKQHRPEASIRGILVQEMIADGVEVIIGTTEDPVFGPVVMFGLGGIFVEALRDVSFRVAPFSRRDAEEMIREIKGYRVLQGVRGKPPVDIDAIVDCLLKVSRLVTDFGNEIREIDINPLVVLPKGAHAVDALIVKRP